MGPNQKNSPGQGNLNVYLDALKCVINYSGDFLASFVEWFGGGGGDERKYEKGNGFFGTFQSIGIHDLTMVSNVEFVPMHLDYPNYSLFIVVVCLR